MGEYKNGVLVVSSPTVPTADSAANATTSDVVGNKTDTVAGDSLYALLLQLAAAAVSFAVPTTDSAANVNWGDVIGNKTDSNIGDSIYGTLQNILTILARPVADAPDNGTFAAVVGNKEDAGALTADTASVVALSRKAAKEAWEVEHHFHVRERWLGLAGAAEGWNPYALPVGNGGTFGAWTEILDAADTPIIAGSTHYDPHRILLRDIPNTKEAILIQFAWGASGAAGYGDGDYTEVYDIPEKPADGKTSPFDIKFPRLPTDTLLWARGKQESADAADGTIDFFIGIHEYTDPDT